MAFTGVATKYFLAYLLLGCFPSFHMDSEFREVRVHARLVSPNILRAWQALHHCLITEDKHKNPGCELRPSRRARVVQSSPWEGLTGSQDVIPEDPPLPGIWGALLLPAGL